VGGIPFNRVWISAMAAMAAGCATRPSLPPGLPEELCDPPRGAACGEIVVALTDRVLASRAPVPTNDAEALIFPQLYQTLARAGCGSTPVPDLARGWHSDADARIWWVEIEPNRHFSDGSPITAETLHKGWRWQARRQRPREIPWRWIDADSISVTAAYTLRIALAAPCPHLPRILCHPALAALRPPDNPRGVPIGSGCARPTGERWRPTELTLEANPHGPAPPWSLLRVRMHPNQDSREALAEGADLVICRDREAIESLRPRASVVVRELPSDRLYAWVAGPEGGGAGAGEWIDAAVIDELAELVVSAPARPAEATIPTREGPLPTCFPPTAADHRRSGERPERRPSSPAIAPHNETGVAFNWRDPTARELAERLAALATIHDPDRPWAAIPLPPHEFRRALRAGDMRAYIVSLSSARAGALTPIEPIEGRVSWERAGARVVPLIEVRGAALMSSDLSGLRIGGEGGVHLDRLGRGHR